MFLSRGDRDLGVAFQTHPGRQAFISSGSKEPRSTLESRRVLALLKKAHFDNPDDPKSFTIVSKKTDDAPTIFLNEYSKSLYMKYKDRETEKGLLFPKKSNQKMNKCLKKIACKLGITREVSKTEYCGNDRSDITTKICDIIATHAGRRTFVVHCAEEGWTEEMIRTYTGHEDFKAMRPYFAIGDKKRRMFMESHF